MLFAHFFLSDFGLFPPSLFMIPFIYKENGPLPIICYKYFLSIGHLCFDFADDFFPCAEVLCYQIYQPFSLLLPKFKF